MRYPPYSQSAERLYTNMCTKCVYINVGSDIYSYHANVAASIMS